MSITSLLKTLGFMPQYSLADIADAEQEAIDRALKEHADAVVENRGYSAALLQSSRRLRATVQSLQTPFAEGLSQARRP